jgi:hypothetical protein
LNAAFTRLSEWGGDDVPACLLLFPGDFPILDRPLPRFLDDAAAAKLLRAARDESDPFARLCVEFLARTGLRRGEFVDLTVDAVVRIGSAFWLRVPVGKMHNDRYIPLHPQLKALLDEWLARRSDALRTDYLFTDHGRRITASRVDNAVEKVARRAGLGRVSPHKLRHTLATQAINRGMSLEAIAALLGHRSLSMTLVYARIADRTVANEYFAVSEKVEGPSMTGLRSCQPPPRARRCASSEPRCTDACWATGTAPGPSRWTAISSPSASPARSSSPPLSSDPHSSGSVTTQRPKGRSDVRRSSRACSPASRRMLRDRR